MIIIIIKTGHRNNYYYGYELLFFSIKINNGFSKKLKNPFFSLLFTIMIFWNFNDDDDDGSDGGVVGEFNVVIIKEERKEKNGYKK